MLKLSKAHWSFGLIMLFLILLLLFWIGSRPPRVLVIQSYSLDYPWTADLDQAIHKVLDQKPYETHWLFMDTKRNPDAASKQAAGEKARALIEEWEPEIILTVDDNAQEYVAKHYVDNEDIQIVFSGVNKDPRTYGYTNASNVTGLRERLDYINIKSLLFYLLPAGQRNFIHISDNTASSQGRRKELEAFNWKPLEFKGSVQVTTFDEWKQAIKAADKIAKVLVLTQYHTILRAQDSNERVPPSEIISWTQKNSKLLMIGLFIFHVKTGGTIAVGPNPHEHGYDAANRVIALLEKNTTPRALGIQDNKDFILFMRNKDDSISKRSLEKLDLSIIYDAYALMGQKRLE